MVHPRGMRVVRGVFYVEAATGVLTALFALLDPGAFVAGLIPGALPPAAVELGRWYGVLLLVLALILWAALRDGREAVLRLVLVPLLVGDAVQIAVALRLGAVTEAFTPTVQAAIYASAVYAAVRVYFLRRTTPAGPARRIEDDGSHRD